MTRISHFSQETVALLSTEVGDKLRELRRGNLNKILQSGENSEGYLFDLKERHL